MEEKRKYFTGMAQIYPEFGASFDQILHWEKAKEWLTILHDNIIPEGVFKKRNKDYRLVFYISSYYHYEHIVSIASPRNSLVIKGPTVSRRSKTVEYVLWIPYAQVAFNPQPLARLTKYFKEGIIEVLRKLEYPEESIQKVVEKINDNNPTEKNNTL